MPDNNAFRHQAYPTTPAILPQTSMLTCQPANAGEFASLHTDCEIARVIVVHGTFMGDDPFAFADILSSIFKDVPLLGDAAVSVADNLRKRVQGAKDKLAKDVANYSPEFRDRFEELVGDDPTVELLTPTWSGQNHHFARADLAVRLLVEAFENPPEEHARWLLWGHSHAGQGFAILTNLLANDRASVDRFFEATGTELPHWKLARDLLAEASGPVDFSRFIDIVAFGTPVRYGWDTKGCGRLLHVLHHVPSEDEKPFQTHSLYPPHSLRDMVAARYGDWVQAFAIAGTDVVPPGKGDVNEGLAKLLEGDLAPSGQSLEMRLLPEHVRKVCGWWKAGTRCHADGKNLLVEYQPSGRRTRLTVPIEASVFGHGVATTLDWLPAHLELVQQQLLKQN